MQVAEWDVLFVFTTVRLVSSLVRRSRLQAKGYSLSEAHTI
jgi:hypothetical protein